MIRLLATLHSVMQCRPHHGPGKASALFASAEEYRFDGRKAVREGIFEDIPTVVGGQFNLDQFMSSGRCRVNLTPT